MTENGSPVRRFFGYASMTIGVLIAFLSGACTLVVISTSSVSEFQSMASVALIIGGPTFIVGILLILLGRWLVRTARLPADEVF